MVKKDSPRDKASYICRSPDDLNILHFCDMERFGQMLKDWADSTGLATVAVGSDGKYVSDCYNFTDFCQKLTRKSDEGLRRCIECDKRGSGIYLCHAGLVDFAAPITLEDGTVLGKIVGGQVLPEQPDEAYFRATARELGIDEGTYIAALRKVNIRSPQEITASFALLSNVINMFVRTSYAARVNAQSLTERRSIITSLSKIYFCDYYIDLHADTFLELDATEAFRSLFGASGKASEMLERFRITLVASEHGDAFHVFTDLPTLKHRLRERKSLTHEFLCRDSGWCRATFIVAGHDESGASHVIFALQDIQEEKEKDLSVRRMLEEAASEAKRANRAKTDFLSRMSHDMRTPLNGIIGMTYLAGKEKNPPNTVNYLTKIDTSSKFLLGLINDILDMAKAECEKIELHPEPYPPEEFYSYLDSVICPLCREKNLTLSVDPHPLPGVIPVMDKLRINQIVFNLLSNAVKYTPEGGTITYYVCFRQLDARGRLAATIRVTDTGIGISREFQKTLFSPFTQEQRKDTAENRGSGLGLAIAKRMVELMGGTISVASEIGVGTCFTLELECDSVPAAEETAPEPDGSRRDIRTLRGVHILLCEDHPLNQEIARALLEEQGIFVETAENGQRGVELFRRSPIRFFSAILMDIRMPVMDGYAAATAIRAMDRPDSKTVSIIAMTADAFADDVRKCMDAGMNAHIAKPIAPKKLLAILADCIYAQM